MSCERFSVVTKLSKMARFSPHNPKVVGSNPARATQWIRGVSSIGAPRVFRSGASLGPRDSIQLRSRSASARTSLPSVDPLCSARSRVHEPAPLEGVHVLADQREPLAVRPLRGEALVPVRLDATRIVRRDDMHHVGLLR